MALVELVNEFSMWRRSRGLMSAVFLIPLRRTYPLGTQCWRKSGFGIPHSRLSVARPMSVLPIREMTGPMDANLGVDGSKNHLSKDTKVQQKCAKDQCREGSFSTSGVTDDSSQVMSRKSGFELDPCDTIPIQRKGQPWLGFWGIHRRLVLFWCCHSDRLGHKATR